MFQLHTSTRLVPPHSEEAVEIDTDMAALVRALWARGWQTAACCQDIGEAAEAERAHGEPWEPTGHQGFIEYYRGRAWLKMPAPDAFALLTELSDHETFGTRVKVRWQRGSWRMHTPVVHQDGRFTATPHTQIYFPKDQIAELVRAIRPPTAVLGRISLYQAVSSGAGTANEVFRNSRYSRTPA